MERLLADYTPLCNRDTSITKLSRFHNANWPSISVKRDDNNGNLQLSYNFLTKQIHYFLETKFEN